MTALLAAIVAFRDARDWGQFHTPRNLAAALAIEAAELQETMLWRDELPAENWDAACQETADVLIYALLMCDALGVSPEAIVRRKMKINAEKYPADEWEGRAW